MSKSMGVHKSCNVLTTQINEHATVL